MLRSSSGRVPQPWCSYRKTAVAIAGVLYTLYEAQSSRHYQQTDFDVGLDCMPLAQAYQSDRMVSVKRFVRQKRQLENDKFTDW